MAKIEQIDRIFNKYFYSFLKSSFSKKDLSKSCEDVKLFTDKIEIQFSFEINNLYEDFKKFSNQNSFFKGINFEMGKEDFLNLAEIKFKKINKEFYKKHILPKPFSNIKNKLTMDVLEFRIYVGKNDNFLSISSFYRFFLNISAIEYKNLLKDLGIKATKDFLEEIAKQNQIVDRRYNQIKNDKEYLNQLANEFNVCFL